MLIAKAIRKSVSGREILRDVDLELPEGQITVVLGRNGAGKSTLLKCLALVDTPDSGEITIDGTTRVFPKSQDPGMKPWPKLTAVFQGLHLWPHMTIRQNILAPLLCQKTAPDDGLVRRVFDDFELTSVLDRRPSQCSGGQRQRAAVARALVLKPRYLLLDEPTASADVEHAYVLSGYLKETAARGVAVLVISHMLGFSRLIANRVVFIESGAVAELGGPELLNSPRHETLRRFVALH